MTTKRGRPREFDLDEALAAAHHTFQVHGYAGASLERLTRAMGLSKPSLYAAFGDKHALFLQVMKVRARSVGARFTAAFARGHDLESSLLAGFEEVVDIQLDPEAPGCMIASSSTTEAVTDAGIRAFTRAFFASVDKGLAAMIRDKVPAAAPYAETISRVANAVLRDIALRARVGESRAKLREFARESAQLLAAAAGGCR